MLELELTILLHKIKCQFSIAKHSITFILLFQVNCHTVFIFYLAPSLRKGFWKFNASFLLINLHLLCLPLVALEFWLSADSLVFFDLWVGMFSAFLYMLWYLLVLDPKGLQFYIILTPRPHWCFLVYFCILFIYVAVFQFWNSLVQ